MNAAERIRSIVAAARPAAKALWRGLIWLEGAVRILAREFWKVARGPLIAALNVVAALIVLFEEWGWRPLSDLLARLARFAPVAAVERWIASLPPYGAVVAFALPTSVLLPLKLVAVWLLANDYFVTATLLFLGAKVVSTALIARVFVLTKPALMQVAWFAAAYNWFVPWKDALFAEIRSSWVWRYGRIMKARLKEQARRAWERLGPQLERAWLASTGRKLHFGRSEGRRKFATSQSRPDT